MKRNVIPGQYEAQVSGLPRGTRPQAVCFCRDTLNGPCTYVNTEHKDTHSQHSEPSLRAPEAFRRPSTLFPECISRQISDFRVTQAAQIHLHQFKYPTQQPPPPSPPHPNAHTGKQQNTVTLRELTPALPGATHEFVGLRIPKVSLHVVYFLVQRPLG